MNKVNPDMLGRLLNGVAKIADAHSELASRRREVLKLLMEITETVSGMWTWGVSDDTAASIAPIATIEEGFSPSGITAIINMGLDPSMHAEFRIPIMNHMQGLTQSTTLRTDLFNEPDWKATQMYKNLSVADFDEWLHCVRYSGTETWASLFFVRKSGAPPYQEFDQQLVDFAIENITWMSATLDNSVPSESCAELTPRQRVVLMMQLDGLSRKQIASRLEISIDTVGDHLKKIHEHFEISSTGELAALFLRNK